MQLLFGIWDISVSSYYVQFLALGCLGFGLCWFRRWLIVPVIGLIGYLAFKDFSQMAASSVGPKADSLYAIQVYFAILLSLLMTIAGFVMRRRRSAAEPQTSSAVIPG